LRTSRVGAWAAGLLVVGSLVASMAPDASAAPVAPVAPGAPSLPTPAPAQVAPATTTPNRPAAPKQATPKQGSAQTSTPDLDLTLVRDATGVHPKQALGTAMRLSPGGRGDLARLTSGSTAIGVGWGGYPLPPPVLNGALATYPDVVFGGDLRVQATAVGFKISLILRGAPLAPVAATLPIVVRGLTVGQALDGDLLFGDPAASVVSRSPAPQMIAANIGPFVQANRVATAPSTVSPTAFGPAAINYVVKPPPAWLADPVTIYPVTLDLATIYMPTMPLPYLNLYQAAAATCPGLPWSVVAAIGNFETNHGRSNAPGVHSGANFAGAKGPMQFLSGTFAVYDRPTPPGGVDPPTPYDPTDAVYAAARNLCANGGNDATTLASAVFAYNHADWYVNEVLSLAAAYDSVLPPVTSPAGTPARFALSHIGEPYLYGGNGPGSYDCSGLVQAAYRAIGMTLPRGSHEQFYARPRLPGSAPLRPGDLVGFGSPSNVSHIGIYIGSGLMIDAPHTGASLRIENFHWNDYVGATRPVLWEQPPPPPAPGAPQLPLPPGSPPVPGPAVV
jgi:cell wall-associated NlpC family hydrolase